MNPPLPPSSPEPLSLGGKVKWMLLAIFAFHLSYEFEPPTLFFLFLLSVLQLARAASGRGTFYLGLVLGLCIYGPQLAFFWSIFHEASLVLWLVLGCWLALYLVLQRFALLKLGDPWGALIAPLLWTGLEYSRSELYYLRFSWLNAGYLSPAFCRWTGVYGMGFMLMLFAALLSVAARRGGAWRSGAAFYGSLCFLGYCAFPSPFAESAPRAQLIVAGTQLEEASEATILQALNELVAKQPDAQLLVLSEYTFSGQPPSEIREWCAKHKRYLIAGGKDFLDAKSNRYRNTAFVVGPNGSNVFVQAKSVPIQLFDDGLPAAHQAVWDSPWGRLGLCVCYDLSYSRVTDELIRQGAQAIIVPTMDVTDWGRREHNLHARVAPVRAAEYGVPIFRLCSSGISQAVGQNGQVLASAPFPGQGQILAATLTLPPAGGRLPLDRWLAWPCVVFVVSLFGWQVYDGGRNAFKLC